MLGSAHKAGELNMNSAPPGYRGQRGTAAQRGYGARWQRYRAAFLREHPLCVMCEKQGKVTAATVVDHRIPHKGDQTLFWDLSNHQALCKPHHDRDKRRVEAGSAIQDLDASGWPVEG
jgi:5-methylcytosine-specific restriction protein A